METTLYDAEAAMTDEMEAFAEKTASQERPSFDFDLRRAVIESEILTPKWL